MSTVALISFENRQYILDEEVLDHLQQSLLLFYAGLHLIERL